MRITRGWLLYIVVAGLALLSDLVSKHLAFAWLGMPGEGQMLGHQIG